MAATEEDVIKSLKDAVAEPRVNGDAGHAVTTNGNGVGHDHHDGGKEEVDGVAHSKPASVKGVDDSVKEVNQSHHNEEKADQPQHAATASETPKKEETVHHATTPVAASETPKKEETVHHATTPVAASETPKKEETVHHATTPVAASETPKEETVHHDTTSVAASETPMKEETVHHATTSVAASETPKKEETIHHATTPVAASETPKEETVHHATTPVAHTETPKKEESAHHTTTPVAASEAPKKEETVVHHATTPSETHKKEETVHQTPAADMEPKKDSAAVHVVNVAPVIAPEVATAQGAVSGERSGDASEPRSPSVRDMWMSKRQFSEERRREVEADSRPTISKAAMSTSVDEHSVRAAYEDVRSDTSDTQWAVFKFKDQSVVCSETGVGFDPFRAHFVDDERAFGFIRIQMGDEMSKRQKFVFLTWVGPDVSVIRRAKMSIDKAMVKNIIKNFAVELQVETLAEINEDYFREQLARAGGANYGTGFRD